MIKTMVRESIKTDIGQIEEIEEYCSVVDDNMDRLTKTDQCIIRTIEVILKQEILEGICNKSELKRSDL